jgi:hypothetical protein
MQKSKLHSTMMTSSLGLAQILMEPREMLKKSLRKRILKVEETQSSQVFLKLIKLRLGIFKLVVLPQKRRQKDLRGMKSELPSTHA